LPLLNSKSMQGKFAVGEFFDGNLGLIQTWLFNGMQGRASAFDFPTRFMLAQMCNRSGPFNMGSLDHAGLAGSNPLNAVTFVENHDTDSKPFEAIIRNKALGYAYILTSEGYPCVFYKDYSTDPGCFGLKKFIDPLLFIHEKIAAGGTAQRFKDFDLFAYERLAGAHLLTALNNDEQAPRTITVETGFGAHVALHDYTGHAGDIQTDANGRATLTVPKNLNGLGYVGYSRQGIAGKSTPAVHTVTQAFDGAQDLDIKPATPGQSVQVGRVWSAAGQMVRGVLRFDSKAWTATTSLLLEAHDPNGKLSTSRRFSSADQGQALEFKSAVAGWHTFTLQAFNTPASNTRPTYSLEATYMAAPTLK
jgi:alpha-amylase